MPNPPDPILKARIEQVEQMKNLRKTWEDLWTQVSPLTLPSRPFQPPAGTSGRITQPQNHPSPRVFDPTTIIANEMFAAQLAAQLVNPQIRWFALRSPDEALARSRAVTLWLQSVESQLRRLFDAPSFTSSLHELFLEMGAFGTGVLFVPEERRGLPSYIARPLSEIFLRQDALGRIDAVARIFELTLRQAREFFGTLPDELERRHGKNSQETLTLTHYVHPRENGRTGGPARMKPWASIYFTEGHLLRESGFDDFPYMVARWLRAPDELYGRGPGTTILPANRLSQRVMEVTIRGAQKVIDPPWLVADDGLIGPLRTSPGKTTTKRAGLRKEDQPTPLLSGARPDFGEGFLDTLHEIILRAYFVDPSLLRPPEPRVTATAVIDSRDMRFQRMTPMIERLQAELLIPLIDRTFNILQRAGRLPSPPPELVDRDLKVEFVSPAALAQLVTEADNMTRFLTRVAPLGEAALATINGDQFIRKMAQNLSIPAEVLNDPRAAQQLLAASGQDRSVAQFGEGAKGSRDFAEGLRSLAAIQQGRA